MSAPPFPTPERLDCPQCGHTITYHDPQNSAYFACPNCRCFFEAEDDKPFKVLQKKWPKGPDYVPQVLPLGARAQLPDGLTYQVIGFMARREARNTPVEYKWGEYVLFSPPATYAQLAEYEGHWMFIKPAPQTYRASPMSGGTSSVVDEHGKTYDLYNRYSPRIWYADGEFDWDIQLDETLNISEFIAPPQMLIREVPTSKRKGAWYRAEHIDGKTLAAAFNIPYEQLPYPRGIGAVQPGPGAATWPALWLFSVVMMVLVGFTQLAFGIIKPEKEILNTQFSTVPDSGATGTNLSDRAVHVTPTFQVNGPAALSLELNAPLVNQWVEVAATLVNEQTGESYEFARSLEHYSGMEDGESWSEGSPSQDATLANIPSGHYHLNIYPAAEKNELFFVSLVVKQHTPLQSNTILLILLLAVYPAIQFMRQRSHEGERWANSDYGPE